MRIAKLLEAKGAFVATVPPDATIAEAVNLLKEHGVGALVVSDDSRQIAGILSERDVVRALAEKEASQLLSTPVQSIMSPDVSTCSPEDDTDTLVVAMTEGRFRHVPVVAEGALVGIVSIGDIVKTRMSELERDRKELVDYINAR